MTSLVFGLKTLLFCAFLLLTANVVQNIYIPTHAIEMGMPTQVIGLLGSLYFTGFLLGCIFIPRFLYNVGHIRTFSAFSSLAASSTLLMGLGNDPILWLILRLVSGFSLAGLYICIESWISGFTTSAQRGKLISIYRIVDIFGCLVGQAFLFQFIQESYVLYLVSLVFMMCSIPLSLTKVQAPLQIKASAEKFSQFLVKVHKSAPLSLYGVLASGWATGIFWALLPVFNKAHDLPTYFNPLLVSVYLVGGILVQWHLGHWSDYIDRRLVLLAVSFVGFITTAALSLFVFSYGFNWIWVAGFIFVFGAANIPIYSISVAHANDWISSESIVNLSILLLVLSGIGSTLGPLVASTFPINLKFLFVYMSLAHGILFLLAGYRLMVAYDIRSKSKSKFQILSQTASAIVASERAKRNRDL